MNRPLALVLLGALLVVPRPRSAASATEAAPGRATDGGGLDELGERLAKACRDFEQDLEAAPAGFDLPGTLRRLDDELVELRWELDRRVEAGALAPASSLRLLLESTADELAVARARLTEVARVGPELCALVRLHREMRESIEAGCPERALELYRTRVPEPLDPLDWPSVVRRRIRDVEREVAAAQSAPSAPPARSPGAAPAPRSSPAAGPAPAPR